MYATTVEINTIMNAIYIQLISTSVKLNVYTFVEAVTFHDWSRASSTV